MLGVIGAIFRDIVASHLGVVSRVGGSRGARAVSGDS